MKSLILSARKYQFPDRTTGEEIKGARVQFVSLEKPANLVPDPDTLGLEQVLDVPITIVQFESLGKDVPGFFNIELEYIPSGRDSRGRPNFKPRITSIGQCDQLLEY